MAEVLYNIGGLSLPLYVFSGLVLVLAIITWTLMREIDKATDKYKETEDQTQAVESNVDVSQTDTEEKPSSSNKKKVPILKLFTYKLFVFALIATVFNLILYVLLEPTLSDRLTELGVKEESIGQYF